MKQHQEQGFIMVIAMMIIAITVVLVSQLFVTVQTNNALVKTVTDREKAYMLALSGVELAMSQLTVPPQSQQPQQEKPQEDQQSQQKESLNQKLLLRALPGLNRWQQVRLNRQRDGIKGTLEFAIVGEDGKYNINEIYNFKTKKFKDEGKLSGDYKKTMQEFFEKMKPFVDGKDLFEPFTKFLSERGYPLNDVTELLTIDAFSKAFANKVFYHAPNESEKKRPLYLTDIFTTFSASAQIEPWLFSDSISGILGLPRAESGQTKTRTEQVKGWVKNFKESVNWSADWTKILQPVYGKDFNSLPKSVHYTLQTNFNATVFSVISQGTVGNVTQRVFAIIEKQSNDGSMITFAITKLYWL